MTRHDTRQVPHVAEEEEQSEEVPLRGRQWPLAMAQTAETGDGAPVTQGDGDGDQQVSSGVGLADRLTVVLTTSPVRCVRQFSRFPIIEEALEASS